MPAEAGKSSLPELWPGEKPDGTEFEPIETSDWKFASLIAAMTTGVNRLIPSPHHNRVGSEQVLLQWRQSFTFHSTGRPIHCNQSVYSRRTQPADT